mgnify:FL=1
MTTKSAITCAATALLLLPSCSVKEDRQPCPCWLTVVLDDASRTAPDAKVLLMSGNERLISESVSPEEEYERTVPRGYVRTVVCTGADLSVMSTGTVAFRHGEQIDTIWSHTAVVDCRNEFARDTAALHRQFAVARLVLKAAPEEDDGRLYSVETSCGGLDLQSSSPTKGGWGMRLVMDGTFGCVFSVPRMRPEDRFAIRISNPDGGDDEVDIQAMLRDIGYSWSKRDLDDMVIALDYARGTVDITVLPWEDGGRIEETI